MTPADTPARLDRPTLGRALARPLRGRCPWCGRGAVFAGPLALAPRCPACGAATDGDGSAVTAGMVFGFGVPLLVALPLGFVLIARDAPLTVALGLPCAVVVLAAPAVVRLSKALWIGLMAALGVRERAP